MKGLEPGSLRVQIPGDLAGKNNPKKEQGACYVVCPECSSSFCLPFVFFCRHLPRADRFLWAGDSIPVAAAHWSVRTHCREGLLCCCCTKSRQCISYEQQVFGEFWLTVFRNVRFGNMWGRAVSLLLLVLVGTTRNGVRGKEHPTWS